MKKEYLIDQSKLILIETPANFNDLIGKYYLHKLKNGKNCFYKITSINWQFGVYALGLYSTINGKFNHMAFSTEDLPLFFEIQHIDKGVKFNVFE